MKKGLVILLCLFCLTGCKSNTELKETTTETESETEETTKSVEINSDEKFKETDANDSYINLEDVPEDKLNEDGSINITDNDIREGAESGEVQLYNLEDKKKALDFKIPEGYQLLNLTGNEVFIKHMKDGVPFSVEILDGTKEENIAKMEEEMKSEESYLRKCSFDISREENLSGIDCSLRRKNDFYDYADQYREYTNYCFADFLGNTVLIRVAEDIEYIVPEGVEIETYEAPIEIQRAMENLAYATPYYKEILTGVSYK